MTSSSGKPVEKSSSPTPSLTYDSVQLSGSKTTSKTSADRTSRVDSDEFDIYSSPLSSESERISLTNTGETPNSSNLSKLTPIRNVEIGALIPLSANGDIQVRKKNIKKYLE